MDANSNISNYRKKPKDRANPDFHLSQSSLRTINIIIMGYARIQGTAKFKAFTETIGEKRPNVTLAHGFLLDLGIIEGDFNKSSTQLGRELGMALINGTEGDIKKCWAKVIDGNNYCLALLRDISQRGEVTRTDFQKRIFYFAKYLDPNKDYRVGANTLINIFQIAGYVTKSGNYYKVYTTSKELEKKYDQVSNANHYIFGGLITELENIKHHEFDQTRLVKYCKEINDNFERENFSSVIFLCRAVLDHCPPIFGYPNFESLCIQLPRKNSLKHIANHLNDSLKRIADHHIHKQIGAKEVLPLMNEIENFKSDMNFLIARIVEKLSMHQI